jgi:Tol biopolymer transport system component
VLIQEREHLSVVRRDSTPDGACRAGRVESLDLKGLGEVVIKGFNPNPLNPRLSRDGRQIAMSRQAFGRLLTMQSNPEPADTPAVIVVPISGGEVKTLRLLPQDMSYGGPDWSLDGTQLYFADVAPDGVYRIHRMTLATGAVDVITQGSRGAVHPRLSPDGSTIAVTIVDTRSRVWLLKLRPRR